MNNKKNIHKNPVDLTPTLPVKEFSITKLFSAYSYIYSPDYQFRGESHEAIELICINQGEVTIILDDKEFILKKHQMFLHKPWDFHKIKANNVSCHAFFLSFAVDDETVLNDIYNIPIDANDILLKMLSIASNEGFKCLSGKNHIPSLPIDEKVDYASNQTMTNLIELILIGLKRMVNTRTNSSISKENFITDSVLVHSIIDYLEKHITEKLSLNDIAEYLHYSVSHISNVFTKAMNCSIINYLINLRIQKAKEYIIEGKYTLKEISAILNFDSPQYFSLQFKKLTGLTLSQYKTISQTKKWMLE